MSGLILLFLVFFLEKQEVGIRSGIGRSGWVAKVPPDFRGETQGLILAETLVEVTSLLRLPCRHY